MKKQILGIFAVCLVLTMFSFVMACGKNQNYAKVDLFEKDLSTWEIIEDGASGTLVYSGKQFAFNGRGLEAGVSYTLIRYLDPWATHEATCLGTAEARANGNLIINGEMLEGGPKVWLVPTSDVNCETKKINWANPIEYLFEHHLI